MPPRSHPLHKTVYTGTFISCASPTQLEVQENTAVGVDEQGKIVWVEEGGARDWEEESSSCLEKGGQKRGEEETVVTRDGEEWRVVRAGKRRGEERWWFPGFVDTHIHAPQLPNTGLFGSSTLLDWLKTYTFPVESSFQSPAKAQKIYSRCVDRTLSNGTTTAAYYATIHVPATNILASTCHSRGQRAFIGRCCMDSTLNPEYYRDASAESAVEDTKATIRHVASIDPEYTLISPIITPRFAPSCTTSLLTCLGDLAKHEHLPVQTHISENPDEVALVADLFRDYSSYAAVYDAFNLLTPRTVLGHAIHLKPSERKLIKQRGASVSHCPISNSDISSGICPVRDLLDDGIVVGLGSDVSGGWSTSILTAAREASMVSRVLAALERDSRNPIIPTPSVAQQNLLPKNEPPTSSPKPPTHHWSRKILSVEECLYLATVGGATCLGLESKIGRFAAGMEWDAQLVVLDHIELDDDRLESGDDPVDGHGQSEDPRGWRRRDEERREEGQREREKEDPGPTELWGKKVSWPDKVSKWMFCGDDRNTRKVFVRGRLVWER